MNWSLRLFAMKSARHVMFRTAWMTIVIAVLVTGAGNRTTLYLFPQFHAEIAFTLAAFAFGMAILFAGPLLWGVHTMALKVTTINRQLTELAARDPLTGLLNRRSFAEEFETLKRKSRRQNCHICALVIDVDHFKSVNDTFGHEAGDRVLTQLGSMLEGHAGASALIARLGGEEFGVLRQTGSILEAEQFAEGLRIAVEQMPVWYNGECLKLTISIGWHVVKQDEELETVLKNADAALYFAKSNGRNQVAESGERTIMQPPALVPFAENVSSALINSNVAENDPFSKKQITI